MSADTSRVDSSEPSVAQAKVNTLSIVSIILVGAAVMGIAVRTWSWGPSSRASRCWPFLR
jgi:hypothetical protein